MGGFVRREARRLLILLTLSQGGLSVQRLAHIHRSDLLISNCTLISCACVPRLPF